MIYIEILKTLALISLTAIGAFIAHRQMQIAHAKLQFDLYVKRYCIFEACRKLISIAYQNSLNLSEDVFREFTLGTSDSLFLLDDLMVNYIHEIQNQAIKLWVSSQQVNLPSPGPTHHEMVSAVQQSTNWLAEQIPLLQVKFEPFLKLEQFLESPFSKFKKFIRPYIKIEN